MEYNDFFGSPALDLGGHLAAYISRVGNSAAEGNVFAAGTIMAGALEGAVMQQNLDTIGISAVRMLDTAIANGQTVYPPNPLTWSSVQGLLTNWTADAIGAMGQTIVANEGVVIVHDDGQTSVGDFVGGGFLNFSAFSGISDTLIGSISSGAATSNPQTKIQTAGGSYRAPSLTNNGNTNVATSIDPVNLFTGSATMEIF